MFRHTRATTVVNHPAMFATFAGVSAAETQPGFLHCVIGLMH